jgi:hypothetical protein
VLTHPSNLGKGQALKTGMNYYLQHRSQNYVGVVTADADGQHLIDDIINVSNALLQEPESLHLGVRECSGKKVPLRSAFGNELTKKIYNGMMHADLRDTQTGLRGVPNQLISLLLKSSSSGYEFEFEMLFIAPQYKIDINQISINTVYHDQNVKSHFRPMLDSMKIYSVFFRFCAISLLSFVLDYALFVILFYFLNGLFFSVFTARILSAGFNFSMNKSKVFHYRQGSSKPFLKYAALACGLGLSSFILLKIMVMFSFNPYIAKPVVDFFLFIISFMVQRLFVFKPKNYFLDTNASQDLS